MTRFIVSMLLAAVVVAGPVSAAEVEFTAAAAPLRDVPAPRHASIDARHAPVPHIQRTVAPADAACLTDTTQADFQAGTLSGLDADAAPGSLQLATTVEINQQNPTVGTTGVGITTTSWGGQTFTPSAAGSLVRVDVNLFCSGCSGITTDLTLSLRATSGGLPTGADLASATIAGFSSGVADYHSATFATPPTLTAGTQYAFVIRPTANPSPGTYALTRSGTSAAGEDVYAGGTRVAGASSGTVWSIPLTGGVSTDAGFRIHLDSGFASPGTLESVTRDGGLAPPAATAWTTLSFSAATPASTSVQFQVAASNSPGGPFLPVGPDGTAGTFFTTSGASLAQFNGYRYLRYRAVLSTSDGAVTPRLDEVTVCYRPLGPPDLRLSKNDGGAVVAPGGTVAYALAYANDGEQPASDVTLTETVPPFTSFHAGASTAGWSCSPSGNAGSTCTLAVGALSAGAVGSATFAVTVDSPLPPSVGQISNTATIADDGSHGADPTPGNNTASDTTPITGADLSITKDDGVTSVAAGGNVTYTIVAANAGPNAVINALVSDTFPAAETCTWTCASSGGGTCTSSGSGHIADTIALPVGASSTYMVACAISPSASGTLSNTATITPPAGVTDPNPANNSATDVDTITRQADLSITKDDGVTSVVAGGNVSYTINAANAGPSSVTDVLVGDAFPAATTCTWTCVGHNGGTCTSSGSGHIADTIALPVGASSTYTVACSVSPSASGTLSNTATIAAPSGVTDPNPANNTATDVDTITTQADVAITISDDREFVQLGNGVDYRIEVTNPLGPSTAVAAVTDVLPVSLDDGAWVCTASGGTTCASGSGNTLSDVAQIAPGGKATYLYSATVIAAGVDDRIANTASVALTNATDPTPADNTATDTDVVVVFRDTFESASTFTVPVDGEGDHVVVSLRLDTDLVAGLDVMPTIVARGTSMDCRELFAIEMARVGHAVAMRAITRDPARFVERSMWHPVDAHEDLLTFAWQAAGRPDEGWLGVDAGRVPVLLAGHREAGHLAQILVAAQFGVPWLVRVTP